MVEIKYKKLFYLTFVILIFTTSVLRVYNINYEDFWIDEIISFWVAEPQIALNETLERHKILENSPFFFNLSLKYIFSIFGYSPEIGRLYVSLLSIFSTLLLILIFKNNEPSAIYKKLFLTTLLCFNIYLIKYSQEVRLYSLIFFLFSLNIVFIVRIFNSNIETFNFIKIILFVFLNILLLMTHPFIVSIYLSYFIFSLFYYIFQKKNLINYNISLVLLFLFSILYFYFFLQNTTHIPLWIDPFNIKFFTNFFFSKFFGSRLVGLIFLIILIYLILKNIRLVKYNKNQLLLLIMVLCTYALPIIYSIIIRPAMVDRYVIFVLIPILVLLSDYVFEIKNSLLKYSLIFTLLLFTIGNFTTETTFKQFFSIQQKHKSDYQNLFTQIKKSKINAYAFNLDKTYLDKEKLGIAFSKYVTNNKKISNSNLEYFYYKKTPQKNSDSQEIWVICSQHLNGPECLKPLVFSNYLIIEEYHFNSLNLKLLKNN